MFQSPNPFLGDPEALAKGKDLFSRGLLAESALALEAALQADGRQADVWRLLGTVHAENDDDTRAIAAMREALRLDPDNPDVCLSLGVSYTNELDTHEAVGFLRTWVQARWRLEAAALGEAPDDSQLVAHYTRVLESLAARHPGEYDLHLALGVLHNLSRDFDRAVSCFKTALDLRDSDYSLWNKLGATLANSGRSGEAIG